MRSSNLNRGLDTRARAREPMKGPFCINHFTLVYEEEIPIAAAQAAGASAPIAHFIVACSETTVWKRKPAIISTVHVTQEPRPRPEGPLDAHA